METFSALLAMCVGNSPIPGEFPSQRPVTRSFDVFFDLRLDEWLSKRSRGWWIETPSRPSWRHSNAHGLCFVVVWCRSVSPISYWRCWLIDTERSYDSLNASEAIHDDVIKGKHSPRYWHFVWGIHRSPVNSPHKGQWRGALMFSLICAWINSWVNNREAGDLRRHRSHYDVIVML